MLFIAWVWIEQKSKNYPRALTVYYVKDRAQFKILSVFKFQNDT